MHVTEIHRHFGVIPNLITYSDTLLAKSERFDTLQSCYVIGRGDTFACYMSLTLVGLNFGIGKPGNMGKPLPYHHPFEADPGHNLGSS